MRAARPAIAENVARWKRPEFIPRSRRKGDLKEMGIREYADM